MFHKVLTLLVVSVVISLFFVMPNDAFGVNTLKNVINFTGTYPAGVDEHDITLSTSLTNKSKAFSFITFRHATDNDASASFRSWEILNTTTIRIYGHSGTPANNDALDFVGYVIEYTNDSDVFVQHENFTLGASATEGERFRLLPTPINSSSSMILPSGIDFDGVNTFIGSEEFARYRIVNNTHWGWKVFDTPATGDNNIFAQIVDWNIPTVRVQTGNTTMISGGVKTVTQTPPIAVQNNQTMFIASYESDGATDEQSNRLMLYMQLQDDGDMVFNRDSTNFGKIIQWQLVEFLDSDMFMIHNGTCIAFGTLPECEEAGAKMASGTTTFDFPIPAVNTTTTIPFSPNAGGFGFSNGRLEGGDRGRIDSSMVTMELTSPTNVRMTRGASSEDGGWGMEVITWGDVAGGIINATETITDTITVLDDPEFIINSTESDVASAVDVGTQFDVTKGLIDTATVLDQVQTSVTTDLELADTATVLDQVAPTLTKDLTDTATVLDEVIPTVTKGLTDTATVLDQVASNITKELADTATVLDQVITNTIKELDLTDTVTSLDDESFVVDKSAVDISQAIDVGTVFNITKVNVDVVVVIDQVNSDVFTVFNITATDLTTILDQVETQVVVTKEFIDIVSTSDLVDIDKIIQIVITDIVTVSDPNLAIIVTPVLPPSGGGGGGGTTPLTGFQRLIGLNIDSEVIGVQPSDNVPSDFEITVFGEQTSAIFITGLITQPEFATWFQFGDEPRELDFDVTVNQDRTSNDPTRIQNVALDDFVLTAPDISCALLDPFAPPQPCIDPILYEIPVEFEFAKGGVTFHEDHIIVVDGRIDTDQCVVFGLLYPKIICQNVSFTTFGLVDGGSDNSVPVLILPILVLGLVTFMVFAIRSGRTGGTTRRKFRKRNELTSMSDRSVRRKFKRGRG